GPAVEAVTRVARRDEGHEDEDEHPHRRKAPRRDEEEGEREGEIEAEVLNLEETAELARAQPLGLRAGAHGASRPVRRRSTGSWPRSASTFRATVGSGRISSGHGLGKPSASLFRVASMPIFAPTFRTGF